jgi:acyl carrier protein
MTKSIEGRVLEIIATASHRNRADLGNETALQDLGINSMDVLTMVFELEEELGITVDTKALAGLVTIGDVIREVGRRYSASVG